MLAIGASPAQVARDRPQGEQSSQPGPSPKTAPNNPPVDFLAAVLGNTEDVWDQIFAETGETYRRPKLVLFSGSLPTPCTTAKRSIGPLYCPLDQRIYLDPSFLLDMRTRTPACASDRACELSKAFLIAREVGRHVQNLLGIPAKGTAGTAGTAGVYRSCFQGSSSGRTRTASRLPSRCVG
jgi:predicted metalloprotease